MSYYIILWSARAFLRRLLADILAWTAAVLIMIMLMLLLLLLLLLILLLIIIITTTNNKHNDHDNDNNGIIARSKRASPASSSMRARPIQNFSGLLYFMFVVLFRVCLFWFLFVFELLWPILFVRSSFLSSCDCAPAVSSISTSLEWSLPLGPVCRLNGTPHL